MISMTFEPFYADEFKVAAAKLDGSVKEAVAKRIKKILENPLGGKPLHGEPFVFSERFLHYRIVYKIVGNTVRFMKIGKRDEVYREY